MPAPRRPRTLADLELVDDDARVELIDGVIYERPATSFVHGHIAALLVMELGPPFQRDASHAVAADDPRRDPRAGEKRVHRTNAGRRAIDPSDRTTRKGTTMKAVDAEAGLIDLPGSPPTPIWAFT